MRKQQKDQKKIDKFLKRSKLAFKRYEKGLFYIHKNIKSKPYKKNPLFSKSFLSIKKKYLQFLAFKITANNMFCILRNNKKNSTICSASSGKYNIKSSKKTLRFTFKLVLKNFFNEIKKKLKVGNLLISIIAPKRLRKKLIKFLAQRLFLKNKSGKRKEMNLIIKVKGLKCFNGCRPKKKRRKKQKRLRILK